MRNLVIIGKAWEAWKRLPFEAQALGLQRLLTIAYWPTDAAPGTMADESADPRHRYFVIQTRESFPPGRWLVDYGVGRVVPDVWVFGVRRLR